MTSQVTRAQHHHRCDMQLDLHVCSCSFSGSPCGAVVARIPMVGTFIPLIGAPIAMFIAVIVARWRQGLRHRVVELLLGESRSSVSTGDTSCSHS